MGTCVGIDFGSWMIKAAAVEEPGMAPKPVALGAESSQLFLPVTASRGETLGASWEQFHRRGADPNIIVGFRDRALDAHSTLPFPAGSWRGVQALAAVFRGVEQSIRRAAPAVQALVVTVPDHWRASPWAFPLGLVEAGWNPVLCVRESLAVLAAMRVAPAENVLLISLGAGSACATQCTLGPQGWLRLWQHADQRISGTRLRQLLLHAFAEEVVRQIRRDPMESPRDAQALHQAVERLLLDLQARSESQWQARLFGQLFTRSIDRPRLAELAAPLLEPLTRFLERSLRSALAGGSAGQVVLWGELASLLLVEERLRSLDGPARPGAVLAHTVVAEGAARLAALAAQGQLDFTSPTLAGLDKATGNYVPRFAQLDRKAGFPLLEGLPLHCCAVRSGGTARLVRLDRAPGMREMFLADSLRLGRDPQSDWVLDEQRYPQVSRAHAAVLRHGLDYRLRDLGSTNGTYLNGRRLQGEALLRHGDVIMLGLHGPSFRFECQ